MTMRLPGAAIRAICEHSVTDLASDLDASVPPEFALPGNPLVHVASLRLAYDLTAVPGQHLTRIEVGGKPLHPVAGYLVATSSFLARGYSGFGWFRRGIERREVGGEQVVLTRALQSGTGLPDVDGRVSLFKSQG